MRIWWFLICRLTFLEHRAPDYTPRRLHSRTLESDAPITNSPRYASSSTASPGSQFFLFCCHGISQFKQICIVAGMDSSKELPLKTEPPSVTAPLDVAPGSSSSTDIQSVPSNLLFRLKEKVRIEPQPGTFAPGRWSNAGRSFSPSLGLIVG